MALTGSVVFDEGIFQVGGASYSSGVLYHNAFRQVRLWNTARTQTQIIDAMDRSLSGTQAGLLHYWPLDDGSGQSARNLTGGPELTLGRTPDPEDTFNDPFWRLTDAYFAVEEGAFPESVFVVEEQLGNAAGSAILDLNADGFPDYFHCGSNFDPAIQQPIPCRFFLNDGLGRFTDTTAALIEGPPPAPTGTNTPSLVADFNGDGRDDLFLVNSGVDAPDFLGEANALILSQPDGTYRDIDDYVRARPCTGGSPAFPGQHWCSLVDDGTFTTKNYPVLEGWTDPPIGFSHFGAAGDIDEDGDIDIYVSNVNLAMPYFLINDGQGQFTVNWEYVPDHFIWVVGDTPFKPVGNAEVLTVSLVDLDGDGHLDLLGRGSGHSWEGAPNSAVYWGDGSGNYANVPWTELPEPGDFRLHGSQMVTKDIDGDSDLDIVSPSTKLGWIGGYIQVLINQTDRTFSDETEQRMVGETGEDETYISGLVPADINGDGCVDLVSRDEGQVGTLYGSLIHLNDCSGSFTPIDNIVLGKAAKPIPLDADQDGDIDFISYRSGGVPGDFTRDWTLLRQIRPYINETAYIIFSDSFEQK